MEQEKGREAGQSFLDRHCLEPSGGSPDDMSSTLELDAMLETLGETEGAFAVDVAQFDACEQSGINFAESSQESPFSQKVNHPQVPDFTAASGETFCFLRILSACLQVNQHTHVGLSDFIRKSLQPLVGGPDLTPSEHVPRIAHSRPRRSRDLMPCPPPMWRWTGPQKLSPRRRRRRKFLALKHSISPTNHLCFELGSFRTRFKSTSLCLRWLRV